MFYTICRRFHSDCCTYKYVFKEGLQEETLPLQKRPLGEGLGNGTFGDVSSFAPAKDKTYFMLPVLLVLTVLYVKRFSMCLY